MQLQVLLGPERGHVFDLHDGLYLAGRGSDTNLRLASDFVSRQHANLHVAASQVRVTDLESSNGTYINGARVVGEGVAKPGDVLLVGDFALRIHARNAPALSATPPDGAIAGNLLEVPAATLLRWIAVLKKTAVLALTSPPLRSEITFAHGHIAEVVVDTRKTRDPIQALNAILRWKGTFEVTPTSEAPASLLLGLDAVLPSVGSGARR